MNLNEEIETEAAQFPGKEYINGNFLAVRYQYVYLLYAAAAATATGVVGPLLLPPLEPPSMRHLSPCHQTGHFAAFQACGCMVPDEPGWLGFLHLLEEETDSLHGVSWLTVQLGESLSLLEKEV
jgi:hypothetical protein